MASSCGKEAGFDHLKNLAMAYCLVPGLEEISAGTRQKHEGGLKGERGTIVPSKRRNKNFELGKKASPKGRSRSRPPGPQLLSAPRGFGEI